MRTLKGFAVSTGIAIAGLAVLLLYQPIAERKKEANMFNSVRKSQTASFWADTIGIPNMQVETNEAVYFLEFLTKHNGGYALPRTNTLYVTLEEALKELRKNPFEEETNNEVSRLDNEGELLETYNIDGKLKTRGRR